jgi:maltose/moltooligosaccharide transporter
MIGSVPSPGNSATKVFRAGSLIYSKKGLFILFGWMLWGDFCFTLMDAVVPSILPLKLRSLGSANVLIGFMMTTLPGIFSFTITPWLSFKSDRYRSSWGRRRPFILLTMPFLTLSMVFIGFSFDIGEWVHRTMFSGSVVSQATVIIVLLAIFAAMFELFNVFVNTVYWYMFNDVVPIECMGRFMALFRLVSTVTSAAYNFFIFQFAESHMREIFLGAALLYLLGFGVMLLRVKEGEYPDPPDDGYRVGLIEKIRIFSRQCFSMRYYWDIFLTNTFVAMSMTIGVFGIFFNKSLGLSLDQIGKMAAISAITVPLCFLFAGSFVDRWNPVRVSTYVLVNSVITGLGAWVWIFIAAPPPMVYVWIGVITSAVFGAPLSALSQTAEMTRLMRLLPREQYGQFSGALAMVRALAVMVGGVLAGLWVDFWRGIYGDELAYRFNFLYREILILLAFYFYYRTYRAWKLLGGDAGYEAPKEGFSLANLKPRPGADNRVYWGLVGVVTFSVLGQMLAQGTWVIYYTWYEPNRHHATIFSIALVLSILLYGLYVLIIRHLERPPRALP